MSGIQRVVREVAVRLLKMPELDIVLFTWRNDERDLTVLDNADFLRCYDEGAIKKNQIRKAGTLSLSAINAGDILFDLDSTWDGRCYRRDEFIADIASRGVLYSSYIYDVIPIMHPEFWAGPNPPFYGYIAANLRHADMLITSVNETVRRLSFLADKAGIPVPPCTVSWLGSDFKSDGAAGEISKKAKKAVRGGRYILCVGTIEPRKNHKVVLDAYDERLASLGINLVFAGRRGWLSDDLLMRIDRHPKKGKGFFFLEGENDAAIAYLYKNAYAVVFPTFDEGFGLPLVEALLHGAVCIASDIPVMHEVGGNACDYFNPKSQSALAAVIEGYLKAPEKYDDCRRRAGLYKPVLWDDVAQSIKDALLPLKKDMRREDAMKDIHAEQIVKEIEEDIAAREIRASGLNFPLMTVQMNLQENLARADKVHHIDAFSPVKGGRLKRFAKRAIRKLVRAAFRPQIDMQNEFNDAADRSLILLERYVRSLENRIAELEVRLNEGGRG